MNCLEIITQAFLNIFRFERKYVPPLFLKSISVSLEKSLEVKQEVANATPAEWELSTVVNCFKGKGDVLEMKLQSTEINRSVSEDS